jgi:hypothetical protein
MNESFRWLDTVADRWSAGIYDFSADGHERVVRFGGNDFQLTWD